MFPSSSSNDGIGRPGRPERGYGPGDPRGDGGPRDPRRDGGPRDPRRGGGPRDPRRGGPPPPAEPPGRGSPGGGYRPDYGERDPRTGRSPGPAGGRGRPGAPPLREGPGPPDSGHPARGGGRVGVDGRGGDDGRGGGRGGDDGREGAARRERASARRAGRGITGAETPPPELSGPAEPSELIPVRRLLSLGVAGFAGLLAIGLIFGAQTSGVGLARVPYAVVIFGIQALFVLAWTVAIRPPAPKVVATVGLVTAAAADVAAVWPAKATAAPIGYVAAAGFIAGVLGQLSRRAGRVRATESLGATLMIVVGVISFALLIVLTRLYLGTQAITVGMTAVGVSLVVARVADAVAPYPRLAPQVPRGAGGIVVGAMCGTFAAAILGSLIVEFTPQRGAVVGLVAALAAVLADLAVGYADAGRRLAGEPGSLWLARHLQGPLGGFALAAPVVYVISIIFLVPNF